MRNTADVADGKPIAVLLQSISGVSAINPLVAFYVIHGRKREVLFFCMSYSYHHFIDRVPNRFISNILLIDVFDYDVFAAL
jgi:hypothetical protein